MIRLNVFISVVAENCEEFVAVAKELVAESQKEAGCVAYDLFASETRSDVYMICETWESQEALTAHSQTEHYTRCCGRLGEIAQLKLEKFDM